MVLLMVVTSKMVSCGGQEEGWNVAVAAATAGSAYTWAAVTMEREGAVVTVEEREGAVVTMEREGEWP